MNINNILTKQEDENSLLLQQEAQQRKMDLLTQQPEASTGQLVEDIGQEVFVNSASRAGNDLGKVLPGAIGLAQDLFGVGYDDAVDMDRIRHEIETRERERNALGITNETTDEQIIKIAGGLLKKNAGIKNLPREQQLQQAQSVIDELKNLRGNKQQHTAREQQVKHLNEADELQSMAGMGYDLPDIYGKADTSSLQQLPEWGQKAVGAVSNMVELGYQTGGMGVGMLMRGAKAQGLAQKVLGNSKTARTAWKITQAMPWVGNAAAAYLTQDKGANGESVAENYDESREDYMTIMIVPALFEAVATGALGYMIRKGKSGDVQAKARELKNKAGAAVRDFADSEEGKKMPFLQDVIAGTNSSDVLEARKNMSINEFLKDLNRRASTPLEGADIRFFMKKNGVELPENAPDDYDTLVDFLWETFDEQATASIYAAETGKQALPGTKGMQEMRAFLQQKGRNVMESDILEEWRETLAGINAKRKDLPKGGQLRLEDLSPRERELNAYMETLDAAIRRDKQSHKVLEATITGGYNKMVATGQQAKIDLEAERVAQMAAHKNEGDVADFGFGENQAQRDARYTEKAIAADDKKDGVMAPSEAADPAARRADDPTDYRPKVEEDVAAQLKDIQKQKDEAYGLVDEKLAPISDEDVMTAALQRGNDNMKQGLANLQAFVSQGAVEAGLRGDKAVDYATDREMGYIRDIINRMESHLFPQKGQKPGRKVSAKEVADLYKYMRSSVALRGKRDGVLNQQGYNWTQFSDNLLGILDEAGEMATKATGKDASGLSAALKTAGGLNIQYARQRKLYNQGQPDAVLGTDIPFAKTLKFFGTGGEFNGTEYSTYLAATRQNKGGGEGNVTDYMLQQLDQIKDGAKFNAAVRSIDQFLNWDKTKKMMAQSGMNPAYLRDTIKRMQAAREAAVRQERMFGVKMDGLLEGGQLSTERVKEALVNVGKGGNRKRFINGLAVYLRQQAATGKLKIGGLNDMLHSINDAKDVFRGLESGILRRALHVGMADRVTSLAKWSRGKEAFNINAYAEALSYMAHNRVAKRVSDANKDAFAGALVYGVLGRKDAGSLDKFLTDHKHALGNLGTKNAKKVEEMVRLKHLITEAEKAGEIPLGTVSKLIEDMSEFLGVPLGTISRYGSVLDTSAWLVFLTINRGLAARSARHDPASRYLKMLQDTRQMTAKQYQESVSNLPLRLRKAFAQAALRANAAFAAHMEREWRRLDDNRHARVTQEHKQADWIDG